MDAHVQVLVEYELSVTVSDIRGAGTDADVFVTLSGDSATSDEIQLTDGAVPDALARSRTDKFVVKAPDVGANKRLAFRLGGKMSPHSSLHLASATLTQKASGMKTVFSFYSWVAPGSVGTMYESYTYQVCIWGIGMAWGGCGLLLLLLHAWACKTLNLCMCLPVVCSEFAHCKLF